MFSITDGKGFQITFKNGITVSIQFGKYNYCENYTNRNFNSDCVNSINAEIAIIGKNGEWLLREYDKKHNDDVKGYQTPEDILKVLKWAEKQNNK